MDLLNSRTTILTSGSDEEKRKEILDYFHRTFDIDSRLYDHLNSAEAFYVRAEPLRHPLIFYYGHTASFYINKLNTAKLSETRINPDYESMFAIGVDEMSWDDLNDHNYTWPSVEEVQKYRQQVRDFVAELIQKLPLTMPITWDSPFWVIMMGIEHQRIHLETSSVIIRRLPLNQVQPLDEWNNCPDHGKAPENTLISVPGATVTLGKNKSHPLYGWDNEFGTSESEVWDFKASKHLVSNEEFLQFIEDNGYTTEEYWTAEGWQWLAYSKAVMPVFWIEEKGNYRLRTVSSEIEMPWNWPVETNYLEAKAFCNWLAKKKNNTIRLPSENEWYRLHDLHNIEDQPYWKKAPGNINLEHWCSPCPVDHFRFENFYDLIGNVWQWTETPISGFEGFEVHPWYDDFSAPTFDTQHNLIKGGSWISTGNEATRDSRYAFRRHFFQHAGFRYVESDQPLGINEVMYESDAAVSQYCEAHYGDSFFGVQNFPEKCATICLELMAGKTKNRALDLGCSVGRASFELAKEFRFVNGLDFSARFIRIAHQMQEKGYIRYELPEEGEIVSYHERCLNDLGLIDTPQKIDFFQADAQNLKPQFEDYDLILAANILDRLSNPGEFLSNIHKRLNMNGYFVLTSPYTWLDEFTPKQNWLGGFRKDGEPYATLEGVSSLLKKNFQMVTAPMDIEFVTRETSRKFQHSISQVTIWQKT
ncbi:MAG: 5-histidylcysteine sulfoxide synthase/putative 4-mercaptohistidine N1-methyltransferase [Desulforhopalus sp.]|jgi:5-histidylcysteine sulfoxide synthase/putative 4-mercaptohistidine N1-methyltranferase